MAGLGIPSWVKRAVAAAAVVLVVAFVGATWYFSNVIEDDLLTPQLWNPDPDLEVISVGGGRIVFTRTTHTQREGIWGLVGEDGYGQVSTLLDVRDNEVERAFRTLEGSFSPGDAVYFDQYAYVGDPESAHGIPFQDVRFPGDGGSFAAWQVDGDRDTWIIFVHGKGIDERRQALRILPALHRDGYPVFVMTYHNDLGAPKSTDGLYHWGLDEWRDIEAAMRFARTKGAEEFILMGYSMGGSIISMFLHQSEAIGDVVGVVLDSPVMSVGGVVDAEAANRGIPRALTVAAKTLARIRFGIEWSELDQIYRADQFDPELPMLVMHGSADETVPVDLTEAFVEVAPGDVTYERFEGVDHVNLWNSDPARYERTVMEFVQRVTPPE